MTYKHSRPICLFFLLALVSCNPKIDTSSNTQLAVSITRVRYALSSEQRPKFDEALLTVVSHDLRDKGVMFLATHPSTIMPEARAAIEGKTGEQIISQARRVEHNTTSKQ